MLRQTRMESNAESKEVREVSTQATCPVPAGHFFRARVFFHLIAWVIAGVLALSAHAQIPPPTPAPPRQLQDPYNRSTPESSLLAFLDTCRARNYEAAIRYLDLRRMAPEQRREEGPRLAQQLSQVLENDPQFDVASLSRDPEGDRDDGLPPNRERVALLKIDGKTVDLQLERDDLRSGLSVWRFSQDTVAEIPELAQFTLTSPIERFLPRPLVERTWIDTALWRWIAMLAAAVILALLARLLSRLVLAILRPVFRRVAPKADWSAVESLVAPVQLLVATGLFRGSMEAINPSAVVRLYLGRTLALLSVSGVAWFGMRLVDLGMKPIRAVIAARQKTFTQSVLPLVARVVKILIVVFGVTTVLELWGYNTGTLLAGLGIGGIAIALAAQKTVENLFGGIAVVSDRPVHVGDVCKVGDSTGTVEDIGLRSTRIRTADRTLVVVPNAQFSSMTLENYSRRDKWLFQQKLHLRRDSSPEQVRIILESITKMLQEHEKVETGGFPVRFVGVGSYSLDIEVFVYLLTTDGDEFLRMQQDLLLRILDAVAQAGTALALPTQANIVV